MQLCKMFGATSGNPRRAPQTSQQFLPVVDTVLLCFEVLHQLNPSIFCVSQPELLRKLLASLHPIPCCWYTASLFIQGPYFCNLDGLPCPFTHSHSNHGRMLRSFTSCYANTPTQSHEHGKGDHAHKSSREIDRR